MAHETPQSVTVLAFMRPEGAVMRVVVRVPMESLRDIQWPLRGPGFLELGRATPLLGDAAKIWIADQLRLLEESRDVGAPRVVRARISLQSDRSFASWSAATAHFDAPPLPDSIDLAWQQAMVDVELAYPIRSATSRFSVHPTLARLGVRTTTVLRVVGADGSERVLTYHGDPGIVHLEPRMLQAAGQFTALGFEHILDGIDHLLFLLCLVIPFRRLRPLLVIVTAFTAAHSITMVVSALGLAPAAPWFPPLVEVLIALSIVYTAVENVLGARAEWRWMVAFVFGLVHGFGFSFALQDSLQFAGAHLVTALAAFNLGVELAHLALLVVAVPILNRVFGGLVPERAGLIIVSALVAHTAWHWLVERLADFGSAWSGVPAFDAATAAGILRIAIGVGAVVWLLWATRPLVRRLLGPSPATGPERTADRSAQA